MISEPMVRSAQTEHLSYTKIDTVSIWTDTSIHLTHVGVPSGLSKMISEPIVRSVQAVHLSYAGINTIFKQTEMSST
jgi:hypothetical protein